MNLKAKVVQIKKEHRHKYENNEDFILDSSAKLLAIRTRGHYYICVDYPNIQQQNAPLPDYYEQIHESHVDILEEGEELTPIVFRN